MDEERYTVEPKGGRRKRRWLRALLAIGLFLVLALGTVVGVSFLWLDRVVDQANDRVPPSVRQEIQEAIEAPPTNPVVSVPAAPTGMDILVVGNDRLTTAENGRSDSLMVVRVDPELDYLAVLSIPRDLWVDIPGHGKAKINAAHAYGGPALAISTVKELTGITIDKYVEIGLQAFRDLTDSLGGVYVDVDHRYFYGPEDAPTIDLQAGYQLLKGGKALDYVRFRDDQNADYGRMARQQRVLMAWRQQAMTWDLPLQLPGILKAFFNNAMTNLGTRDILSVGYWLAGLDGSRVRQIEIRGDATMLAGQAVVMVDEQEMEEAISDYLTPPGEQNRPETDLPGQTRTASGAAVLYASRQVPAQNTVGDNPWERLQGQVSFQLEAPSYIPEGYDYQEQLPDGPKPYAIDVDGGTQPAVKVVYRYEKTDLYLGVTATTWTDAPVASKGIQVEGEGTVFTLVGSGDRIDHVWWKKGQVLYFITNTLFFDVNRDDLLAMAESMTPVPVSSQ